MDNAQPSSLVSSRQQPQPPAPPPPSAHSGKPSTPVPAPAPQAPRKPIPPRLPHRTPSPAAAGNRPPPHADAAPPPAAHAAPPTTDGRHSCLPHRPALRSRKGILTSVLRTGLSFIYARHPCSATQKNHRPSCFPFRISPLRSVRVSPYHRAFLHLSTLPTNPCKPDSSSLPF